VESRDPGLIDLVGKETQGKLRGMIHKGNIPETIPRLQDQTFEPYVESIVDKLFEVKLFTLIKPSYINSIVVSALLN